MANTVSISLNADDQQWAARVAAVLKTHLKKRVNAAARIVGERTKPTGPSIILEERDVPGGEEAFAIATSGPAAKPVFTISGRSRGLLYGAGRLLREMQRGKAGKIIWPKLNITETPALEIRGIYFPTQRDPGDTDKPERPFNSYNVWLAEEGRFDDFEDYLVEMMLWGLNTIGLWYAEWMIAPGDTTGDQTMATVYSRIADIARSWGVKIWLGMSPNLVPRKYHDQHKEHHCDIIPRGLWGQFPVPFTLCPSVPEINRFVMDYNRRLIDTFKPDWIEMFPTDPGGCDCPKCRPWWKKYWELTIELLAPYKDKIPMRSINFWYFWNRDAQKLANLVAKSDVINTVCTQNAWQESTPERLKISDALARKGKKIIFWPDITMAGGWGTWGTYPMPKVLHTLFSQASSVHGVLPYTEGRYDDINKFIMLSLAWNPKQQFRPMVKNVLEGMHNQAMPPEAIDAVLAVEDRNFPKAQKKLAAAARKLDRKTTGDWRWYSLDYYARHAGIVDAGAKLNAAIKKAKENRRAPAAALAKWERELKSLKADVRLAAREMPTLYKKVNDFRSNYDMFCGVKLRPEKELLRTTSLEQAQTALAELRGQQTKSTSTVDRATAMNLHESGKKKK
ncbi:MAG TPA: hypothetical protein VIL86_07885 [Tepidisphaeraceae bacterium]|jgi:hypothetical protein